MKRLTLTALAAVLAIAGCGSGDNSSVREFYPTVKVGMPLAQVIVDGEKAQKPDIIYSVNGHDCGGAEFQAGRHNDEPYVKVSEPAPDPSRPWAQTYHETGYATRDDFTRGVAETLPRFHSCKAFYVTFGRYQGWPSSDSFTVSVDPQGRITSVSELKENID